MLEFCGRFYCSLVIYGQRCFFFLDMQNIRVEFFQIMYGLQFFFFLMRNSYYEVLYILMIIELENSLRLIVMGYYLVDIKFLMKMGILVL